MSQIGSPAEVKKERDRLYHRCKDLEQANTQLRKQLSTLEDVRAPLERRILHLEKMTDALLKQRDRAGELSLLWNGKFVILKHENNKLRHELWQRKVRKDAERRTQAGFGPTEQCPVGGEGSVAGAADGQVQ